MDRIETPLTFPDATGSSISAILAEPIHKSDRAVILCHGFLSTKESRTNRRLTELLVPKGIGTLRFDWFGMGASAGDFGHLTVSRCRDQLEHAIALMQARGYGKLGIIGSSFGGFITLLVSGAYSPLQAIGLKCPVPDFPEMLELEFGRAGMDEWKRTNHIPDVTGGRTPIALDFSFYEDCRRVNAYESARHIHAPVLIVHGERDELVPLHQIYGLEKALPGKKELVLLPGADHQFGKPEDFRTMTVQLADWMHVHLSPSQRSPQGA